MMTGRTISRNETAISVRYQLDIVTILLFWQLYVVLVEVYQ